MCFQDTGYQATKDGIPWDTETNELSGITAPA